MLDISFIAYDIHDIATNGLNWENGLSLAADIACAVLPIATGGGLVVRGAAHIDDALKAVSHAEDLVATAKKLVEVGAKAPEAKSLIRTLTDAATHNPEAKSVIIGGFPEYIKNAGKKTFFQLPGDVWEVVKDAPETWKAINRQFVLDQAGKRFYELLAPGKKVGEGLRLERDILEELGKKARKLIYR